MIRLSKINNEKVKAIKPLGGEDERKWKGRKLFDRCDINVFLCARKRSGKTSTIFKILKECCDKNTNIVVFCSTINKDRSWIAMKKHFEEKGIPFVTNTSLYEGGVNQLTEILNTISEEAKQREEAEENDIEPEPTEKELRRILFGDNDEDKPKKEKKSKFRTPDWCFIFDDLSSELKDKAIVSLCKANRHYNALCLYSSQYPLDMTPEQRKQMDVYILFKGHKEEKLQTIYNDADLVIDFPIFLKLYAHATEKPFSFLYVDVRNDKYRKNFNSEYSISENE